MIHLYSHGHVLLDIYGHVHRRPHLMRVCVCACTTTIIIRVKTRTYNFCGGGDRHTGLDHRKGVRAHSLFFF